MMKFISTFLSLLVPYFLIAQVNPVPPTPSNLRDTAFEQRMALAENSLFKGLSFENIGPTVFSGRVTDVAVNPADPSHFYVAYASGGLWKTENNGTTFTPLFDTTSSITIGAIAKDWESGTIWVGSGEVNSSRSSYAGTGIFKSSDEGKSWTNMGLPESHHIGKVILDPDNSNVVLLAVLGHLYSPNQERGIYKTIDGGQNWKQVLYVNENAGAIDLIQDPMNQNILYASTWERERRAWNFKEAGAGSGIYKSLDGGEKWTKLSIKNSNFPIGENIGRIGLAMYNDGVTSKLYALVDNYNRRPAKKEKRDSVLKKNDFEQMSKETFLALKDDHLSSFLKNNGFPEKYSSAVVKEKVASEKIKPLALKEYLEDANSLLFDTPVIGAEVYVSIDNGITWKKTHDYYLDQVYNSYGYYFGLIRVSPHNPDKVYIAGVPILRSEDGGKQWKNINGQNVHVDHHSLWTNPDRDGHLILGNDGGINISYDDGEHWIKCNSPSVGQFYYINVDMAQPYNVYGGTQDNGVWKGSNNYRSGVRWHNSGKYPYQTIMGGDGMQVMIDSRDNETVYTGFQFGNYFRMNKKAGFQKHITPKHDLGDRPLRWNWQAPIHLSVHNQDILYMGSNFVHRSLNQGDSFEIISTDLTTGGIEGDVAYSTLCALHESPLKFGLLYTGSDDGLVHVTKDGGNTWSNISQDLPEDLWVSRIQASAHEKSRVYVSLNGYRWDNFESHVYASENHGNSWQRIGLNLPMEPVNVVKEDPQNENILYVGTDHGVYISIDRGLSFTMLSSGMPHVPVHDVVVHPRDHDLLIGTHGRSIYKMNVADIQNLTDEIQAKEIHAFNDSKMHLRSSWGNKSNPYRDAYEPNIQTRIYAKLDGMVDLKVLDEEDIVVYSTSMTVNKGIHKLSYDLSIDKAGVKARKKSDKKWEPKEKENGLIYLPKGSYKLQFTKNEQTEVKTLTIDE